MKSSKKILGASAALGLAVALSAGSTFAWFTAGKSTVDVDSFKLQATTSAGGEADLRVAITTAEGASVLSADFSHAVQLYTESPVGDTQTALNNAIVPLEALSWDGNDFVNKNQTATTSGYVKFRLVFESDEALEIYLDSKSSVTPNETNSNSITVTQATYGDIYKNLEQSKYGATTEADGVKKQDDGSYKLTARAANAARIKFAEKVVEGEVGEEVIWCPNEYYVNGQKADLSSIDDSVKTNANPKGFYAGNLAEDFYKVNTGIFDEIPVETYNSSVVGYDTAEGADNKDATPIATTRESSKTAMDGSIPASGYHAVVEIAIWLEGSDGDCFNSILSDFFNVALSFKGVPVA